MRGLLIVGVDPGTTLGYAVLDTGGKLVRARSSRQLDFSSLLEEVVRLGSVLAIGTDKRKCPALIEKIAAATGARIIAPEEDLAVSEKDELTRGIEAATQHEKDAMAAATYAYKELQPLLGRIEKALEGEGKLRLFNEVAETVVIEGINIRDALRQAEDYGKVAPKPEIRPAAPEAEKNPHERLLARQLKRLESENEILRSYGRRLIEKVKLARKELKKALSDKKPQPKAEMEREARHDETVAKMAALVNRKEAELESLAEEQRLLEQVAASGQKIIKKLETLGFEELEQKKGKLAISRNDIVLVERPEIYSERAASYLAERDVTVLARKKIAANVAAALMSAGLSVIPAGEIRLTEAKDFAAADAGQVEAAKKRHGANVIGIIESYRRERGWE